MIIIQGTSGVWSDLPKLQLGNDPSTWPQVNLQDMERFCEDVKRKGSWIWLRNSAVIAFVGAFGKRESEVIRLRREDVWIEGERLFVRFHVSKANRRFKICGPCGERNGVKGLFCRKCGVSISMISISYEKKSPVVAVKNRPLSYPLCQFILAWFEEMAKQNAPENACLFPRSDIAGIFGVGKPEWMKPVNRRAAWDMFQKIPTTQHLWPHLIRHNLATKFAQHGSSVFDLMEWFDWSKYDTAVRYVKMGGGRTVMEMADRNV